MELYSIKQERQIKPSLVKIDRESNIPLIGCIAFGIIDRGTNLLQVRCTSVCNMKCEFCSTAANDFNMHPTNYIVDADYLLDWVKEIVEFKGDNTHIFLDSVGDPLTHPDFVELVTGLRNIKQVKDIIVITNGTLLNRKKVDELEEAGLTRINISLHSLDELKSRKLFGSDSYSLKNVLDVIDYIAKSKIKLMLTPVLFTNVNDEEIENIIKFSKEIGCSIGIQNYEIYKYSRKMKGAKKINYWKFYRKINELEKRYDIKLRFNDKDFNIERRERLPLAFGINEKAYAEIKCNGWIRGQMIGVAKNRCISINNCKNVINDKVRVKIVENKSNIYIGELY